MYFRFITVGEKLMVVPLFLFVALVYQLGGAASTSKPDSPDVFLSVTNVRELSPTNFEVSFEIVNGTQLPLFLIRKPPGKTNGVESLAIEASEPDGTWRTLPDHRELPPALSDPVEIGPGASYEGQFYLTDPYHVSAWEAYPRKAYDIALRWKLRLSVRYFAGEIEWRAYAAESRKMKSPSPGASREPSGRIARSKAFELRRQPTANVNP